MLNAFAMMSAVLIVFYLYLAIRTDKVRRKGCYLIGAAGVLLVIFAQFFGIFAGRLWAAVLVGLLGTIGALVAFGSGVAACYGGTLPMVEHANEEITEAVEHPGGGQGGARPSPGEQQT